MSDGLHFFAIKSIDEATHEVHGRATQEVLDREGEIWDYDTSKPFWEEWIAEQMGASGGKSQGNLRGQHNPKIAAGKLTRVVFNDEEKAIDVVAKVVDDQEWEKVVEGVYTGFSQSGPYIKKWNDYSAPKFRGLPAMRVTIAPKELSLVDRPCVPTATYFEVVKADGSKEHRSFKGGEMDALTTPAVVPQPGADEAKKGLWEAQRFLDLLESCKWLQADLTAEALREGDNSPIPDDLKTALGNLATLAEAYLGEQIAELKAGGAVAAASEGDAEQADKSDAEKAANNGRKAARAALCDAHKAYMDTYSNKDDGDDSMADKAVKSAPTDMASMIEEAVSKALAPLLAAQIAEKAAPTVVEVEVDRPALRDLTAVTKGDDVASKAEKPFDARKAAAEAASPHEAMRLILTHPEFRSN